MSSFQVTTYTMFANNVHTASDHDPVFIIELTTKFISYNELEVGPYPASTDILRKPVSITSGSTEILNIYHS
jgi:hypothetical protein